MVGWESTLGFWLPRAQQVPGWAGWLNWLPARRRLDNHTVPCRFLASLNLLANGIHATSVTVGLPGSITYAHQAWPVLCGYSGQRWGCCCLDLCTVLP